MASEPSVRGKTVEEIYTQLGRIAIGDGGAMRRTSTAKGIVNRYIDNILNSRSVRGTYQRHLNTAASNYPWLSEVERQEYARRETISDLYGRRFSRRTYTNR